MRQPGGGCARGGGSGAGAVRGERAGPAGVGRVIYFDFDSFVVKSEFTGAIDGHAKRLNAAKGGGRQAA